VFLHRACCNNETGVSVLDSFKGSGKKWEFRISEVNFAIVSLLSIIPTSVYLFLLTLFHSQLSQVCTQNLCSAGFRMVGGLSIWFGLMVSVIATLVLG
jgi:hypothetical protein